MRYGHTFFIKVFSNYTNVFQFMHASKGTSNLHTSPHLFTLLNWFNPKRAGGGICPSQYLLLYLSRLLFFHAETSWLFFFKPCARFKTIFKTIGPRVMTRRCVIECWVQRKTDQKLIFNGNYTQIVFFVFRIHFHYMLYLIHLVYWSKNMCKHTLTHIIAKNATFAWKNSEKPWFWRFLVIVVFLTWHHL